MECCACVQLLFLQGSEATGFSKKFPGIDLRLMTLTSNFRIPFYGFFLSMMGIADASRESCNKSLQRGPGSAILLVLGGAKESLDAHPHRDYELTLHRKGFVKVALENKADLAPVFSFGETDVWDQVDNPRGSTLRTIQEKLQQRLGFAVPLVEEFLLPPRSLALAAWHHSLRSGCWCSKERSGAIKSQKAAAAGSAAAKK